jgi:hypothetical protein
VFLTWLPSYLSDFSAFTLDQMALMTMLPLLAGVAGDTLGGVISDAIFQRTGNLRLARRTLLVVGLGGACAFIETVSSRLACLNLAAQATRGRCRPLARSAYAVFHTESLWFVEHAESLSAAPKSRSNETTDASILRELAEPVWNALKPNFPGKLSTGSVPLIMRNSHQRHTGSLIARVIQSQ